MALPNLRQLAATGEERLPEGLRLARAGGVLTLTIDRPGDLNRLSYDALVQLASVAEALRDDATTNVLVITGAGSEHFSMGIMNPAIRASMTKDEVVRLVRLANRVFDALEALPQIVIAAVNGRVFAGAVELALACDIRYAATHSTLCMPEAAWGGFPGAGGPVRLPILVGRARALELICTAREIDAQEMLALGLMQGVFSNEHFAAEVHAIAQRMASNGPLATRGAKRIIDARQAPGFRSARELADALRHSLEWSQDVDEGIAAHRENRQPKFIGR